MKILKKLLLSLMIITLLMQYSVLISKSDAESTNAGYTVTLVPNKTAASEGETIEITVVIDDINVGEEGVVIYAGVIQYDITAFEFTKAVGKGDWEKPLTRQKTLKEGETIQSVALTAETKSGLGHTDRQEVAVVTLTAIQDSTVGKQTITTDKFNASTGTKRVDPEKNPTLDVRVKGVTITSADQLTIENGVVTIPSEINGRAVTDIASKIIENIDGISTIIIPDTVVEIADDAFVDENGNIPEGLTIECISGSEAEKYLKDHNINYETTDKTIESISVIPNTVKTQYAVNEELNIENGKLEITYTDGTKSEIYMKKSGVEITGFDTSLGGTKTVTVAYKGKTATYDIEIIKAISKIEVTKNPDKTSYIQNYENLDLTGGLVTITFDDNTTDTVRLTDNSVNVTGFDNKTIGANTLTVSYGGKTTTFDVTIISKSISSISVKTNPSKTAYIQNYENIDLAGGVITITYDDTTTEDISMKTTGVTHSGFDNTNLGTNTVTVSYGGKSATFDVTIVSKSLSGISVKNNPAKTSYIQNYENLDLTGGVITLIYNDTSTEDISMTTNGVTNSGFNNTNIGTSRVTISYSGFNTTFDVRIVAKSVVDMEISTEPNKKVYVKDKDELDLTGGKLLLSFNDESTETINMSANGVQATGFDNTSIGQKIITVTYEGISRTFTVDVTKNEIHYKEDATGNGIIIDVIDEPDENGRIEIPSIIGGKPVTKIEEGAIKNISEINTIYIPSSITEIPDGLFDGNSDITIECESGSYAEQYAKEHNLNYELIDKTIKGIEVILDTIKTEYEVGDKINTSGGRMILTYEDDTTSPISINKNGVEVTGFESETSGIKVVTVKYKDNENIFEITINKIKMMVKPGDADLNGKINATDLLLVKRHIVAGDKTEWILVEESLEAGDMNEDGVVDATDLLLLKKAVIANV